MLSPSLCSLGHPAVGGGAGAGSGAEQCRCIARDHSRSQGSSGAQGRGQAERWRSPCMKSLLVKKSESCGKQNQAHQVSQCLKTLILLCQAQNQLSCLVPETIHHSHPWCSLLPLSPGSNHHNLAWQGTRGTCGLSRSVRTCALSPGCAEVLTCAVSVLPIATGLLERGRRRAQGHTMLLRWRDLLGQTGGLSVRRRQRGGQPWLKHWAE